jgi:nitrate/nitrite-specific signal transduction histidine kinase
VHHWLTITAIPKEPQLIDAAHQLLVALAQLPAVRDRDRVACPAFLADLLKQYSHYLQPGTVEQDGNVSCTAIPDSKPINIINDPLFRRVFETRDFAIGDYRIGFISGKSAIALGYPLFDQADKIQGMVFASLDLSSLNELAAQVLMPPGSTLTIRDPNGTIVARYPDPEKWVGKSVPEEPIFKIIQNRQSEGTAEAIGVDNIPRLYAFTPARGAPQNDLSISVGIPTDVAFAEVNQTLARNLVTLGLAAALALTAAWFGADLFLLRHVRVLLSATSRLANGDLSARTGLHYGIGELSQLARAFDQTAEKLEQRDSERKRAEAQVLRWSARLGLINAVAEAISQPLETSKIVDIALRKTLNVMDLAAGCAFLKQGEDFILVAHNGLAEAAVQRVQRFKPGEKATSEITRLVHSDDVQNIAEAALASALASGGEEFQTWTSVPIKSKGRAFGVMCLASKERQGLEANEQGVLAAVGQQVGVAIENAELYEQVKSIAALKERERLGRELHDGLAQVLGYLCTRNKVAADLVASGETRRAEAQLQEMQKTMEEAYQDVRESILGLRMTVSPNRGLGSALKEYAHKFTLQTGIRVNLIWSGDDHIERVPEAEVQLLRIIQEALSNVRKHSGARQAWIRFEPNAESATVTIEDDGKGFDPTSVTQNGQPHFGLQTMRERAEGVGGSLQVWSQSGQGTRVVVTLPLTQGGE